MGYLTDYELTCDPASYMTEAREEELEALIGYDPTCLTDIKWYDWDEHMTKWSKKHPDTLWCLEGRGEDSDDMWRVYFKNGKRDAATLSWSGPNKDKLGIELEPMTKFKI